MRYLVPEGEIDAVSRTGADSKTYTIRRRLSHGRYEGELILCEALDCVASLIAEQSMTSEEGTVVADFFRCPPFNFDIADEGPELTEDEIGYANSFVGARLYRELSGHVCLDFFSSEEELELNYLDLQLSFLSL